MNIQINYSLLCILHCFIINSESIIKIPYAAGSFYPKDQQELIKTIADLHKQVGVTAQDHSQPKILIVPHAGYMYSGIVATKGYATIQNQPIETFVIIGPYHKKNFSGVSIWTEGSWETPLGKIEIDHSLAKTIQQKSIQFNYTTNIHNLEHSLEVQVPFIQYFFPQAKIIPILISDPAYSEQLADILYNEILKTKKNIAIIISTDMSHYHDQQEANRIDKKTIQTLQNNDALLFHASIANHESELCGTAAIKVGLLIAKKLRDRSFVLYDYRTSADSTGDTQSVVGYFTAGLITSEKHGQINNSSYTKEQQQILLAIARKTLIEYLKTGQTPLFEYSDPFLKEEKAVFVTLWKNNTELRGCIGSIRAQEPLGNAIIHMTIEAATKDPRFKPVTIAELDSITIEISLLSTVEKVSSADHIIFKKHGVILTKNNNQGVFLPEVAHDFATKEDFLNELCTQKAGLPHECWKDDQTKIEIFTTEVIQEDQKKMPQGKN